MRSAIDNRTAAILLIAVALFVGCGGDDSNTGGGAGSASGGGDASADSPGDDEATDGAGGKAQFVDEAKKLCAERKEQISTRAAVVAGTGPQGRSQAALAKALLDEAIAPGLEQEIDDLRTLEPPADEFEQVEKILRAIEADIRRARRNPAAVAQEERPFARAERLANAYGLRGCGGP